MTLRVSIGKFEKTRDSMNKPSIQTDVYRCQIVDMQQRAFIVLKHPKKRLMELKSGDTYLVDKIKLMINRMGELVLISTSVTVLRVESDETHTIESMELSQKQYSHRKQMMDEQARSEKERAFFQNVTN